MSAARLFGCGVAVGLSLLPAACGYRAVNAPGAAGRVHVKLVRSLLPDAVASDEVVVGLREELARHGRLESGDEYPRVEVEVLAATESTEGIGAGANGPMGRATTVAVVARGWLQEEAGATPERDTGDIRSEEVIAADETPTTPRAPDPRSSVFHFADAVRAAGRKLGQSIARRVMGLPAPSYE
jgi:hypothetical protein